MTRRQGLSHCTAGLLARAGRARPCGAAAAPAARALRILVVGDSLSAEYGLPRGSGWVSLLPNGASRWRASDASVVNASISGDTTAGRSPARPACCTSTSPGS